jgi:hypothetical protein
MVGALIAHWLLSDSWTAVPRAAGYRCPAHASANTGSSHMTAQDELNSGASAVTRHVRFCL